MLRRPPRSPRFPYTTLSRSATHLRGHPPPSPPRILSQDRHRGARDGPWVSSLPALGEPGALNRTPSARRAEQALKDRKSTRLNSSHANISYAVFCLKKKKKQ